MPRSLVLGNDTMHVSFDRDYELRDIFYPHVGQENHTAGEQCRTGIWFRGMFSWLTDPKWEKSIRYISHSLVSEVTLTRADWGLQIVVNDAVDLDRALLVRKFVVRNTGAAPGEIRLFFHYDFHIYGVAIGDTVLYDPHLEALIAYKGRRYFIGNVSVGSKIGLSGYAMGVTELNGREGTWRDAEDGRLSQNPVAQGSVDSTIQLDLGILASGEVKTGYHWLGAGSSRTEIVDLDLVVRERGPENFIVRTRDWWAAWRDCEVIKTGDLDGDTDRIYGRSLLTIRSHLDVDGAVIAATDWDIIHYSRDTYNYCWVRDGALVSIALIYAGHLDAARKFFEFCEKVFRPFDGYFLHKFTPTGDVASTWHPWVGKDGKPILAIQEDETGIALHALWEFYSRTHAIEFIRRRYRPFVRSAADWITEYVDPATGMPRPSYDLWEERWGVHAYTIAAAWAGLQAAIKFAELFNQMRFADGWRAAADKMRDSALKMLWDDKEKHFGRSLEPDGKGGYKLDSALDSSILMLSNLGMIDPNDERMVATAQAIEDKLWCNTSVGGLARYQNDMYQNVAHGDSKVPGNPWVLTTMWLAQYRAQRATDKESLEKAKVLIHWAESHAQSSGLLSEQLNPYTGEQLSVSPLTWSHAEYVRAVQEYLKAGERLGLAP
jgi:oligosaccharide amylase